MNIRALSQDTINQIAAGEVLERPANLVKELVENSLDAGATEIEIEIDAGGKWLRITDNGHGIYSDELSLALSRHATSKIQKFSDLWSLHTFGFRGEALASAAAVSRLTLTTRRSDDEFASQIQSQFGKITEVKKMGGNYGTQILVESLFENVPARLKFLKTDPAEVTQILKVLKAVALSNPQTTIKVKSKNELKAFYTATTSKVERVKQVLNISELYEANFESNTSKVRIIFSSPNQVTNSLNNIWIFVQGRWIQDKGIAKAILDSYQNLLMHGEYPYCVLFIETDPSTLDINIHPTKSQIKFQNSGDIFRLVYGTLRKQLEKAPWLKEIFEKPVEFAPIPIAETNYQAISFEDIAIDTTLFKQKVELNETPAKVQQIPVVQQYWGQLQAVGQINLTYILAQSRHALMLVDQHAAHERVMFERLMTSWRNQNIETQALLIPLAINLDTTGVQTLLLLKDQFTHMGIHIDQGGPDSIFVSAIPALVKESAVAQALEKISREAQEFGGSSTLDKIMGDIFASLACHSVVRAGQALSVAEMQELLQQMDEHPLSSFCPHGRPVYKEILFKDLDRDFGRIV